MGKEVVSISSVARPKEPETCGGCLRPLTVKRYELEGNHLVCSPCYAFLQLSAEEKRRHLDEAKAAVGKLKQCYTCGTVKTEGIRTFKVGKDEARSYCTTCIGGVKLSAEQKWTLNQAEMSTKKMMKQ